MRGRSSTCRDDRVPGSDHRVVRDRCRVGRRCRRHPSCVELRVRSVDRRSAQEITHCNHLASSAGRSMPGVGEDLANHRVCGTDHAASEPWFAGRTGGSYPRCGHHPLAQLAFDLGGISSFVDAADAPTQTGSRLRPASSPPPRSPSSTTRAVGRADQHIHRRTGKLSHNLPIHPQRTRALGLAREDVSGRLSPRSSAAASASSRWSSSNDRAGMQSRGKPTCRSRPTSSGWRMRR